MDKTFDDNFKDSLLTGFFDKSLESDAKWVAKQDKRLKNVFHKQLESAWFLN